MLSYYGSKWTIAPRYPRPEHRRIIEPFAGGASYALLYPDRDVLLVDKNEKLIAVWQFLIGATPADILAIPLLGEGQTTDDLPVSQEARWLVGWWCGGADHRPRLSKSSWARARPAAVYVWSTACRARIAAAVPRFKHWRAVCASYEDIDTSEPATWFVDPPYQDKGRHYPHGSRAIDFARLGAWCRSLPGQVMVCENAGATWLPFEPFVESQSSQRDGRKSAEVLWTNTGWRAASQQRLIA